MTKSLSRKVVTKKKAQTASRKARHKVAAERASTSSRVKAPSVDEEVRINDPQVAPDAMSAPSTTVSRFGATEVQVSMHGLAAKSAPQQIEDFRAEVPASLRELVERTVAQTRSFYQQSADAFQEAFESWESSLDAAGQGAVALNHKIVDIADRNIRSSLDLATRLVACNDLAEAMELKAAYWRQQLSELRMQAEEVRVLIEKVTCNVTEPIKAQVTRDMDEFIRRLRSTRT